MDHYHLMNGQEQRRLDLEKTISAALAEIQAVDSQLAPQFYKRLAYLQEQDAKRKSAL